MTKRFLIGAAVLAAALLVLGLNLGTSGTASATEPTATPDKVVDTHASVTESANPPIVNAKWELPDMQCGVTGIQYDADPSAENDLNGNEIEDADDNPLTVGMQMYPNLCDECDDGTPEVRQIEYWVAAEDTSVEDIKYVYSDVFHPDGSPKYQVDLVKVDCSEIGYQSDNPEALDVYAPLLAAVDTDQITMAEAEDIVTRCYKNEKAVYKGVGLLHHHQPAGTYLVRGTAEDQGGGIGILENTFYVMPIVGLRIDFSVVDWGDIEPGQTSWVSGDGDLSTPAKPTVKNCGNVLMALGLHFSKMVKTTDPLKTITAFDAKFMDKTLIFEASVPQWFPPTSCAPPCTPKELDLSIHPEKLGGEGVFEGTLDLYAGICGE